MASPERRYAGIRSPGADQPEQRRGDRDPGRRPALGGGGERGEAEGVVQHAGVDPVGARGRRASRRPALQLRPGRPGWGRGRASRGRDVGVARAEVDQRVEHPLAGAGELGEAEARTRSRGLPRRGSGLALARRQQDQHGPRLESSRRSPVVARVDHAEQPSGARPDRRRRRRRRRACATGIARDPGRAGGHPGVPGRGGARRPRRRRRAPRLPDLDRTDLPFVTIDPPSSMDLDQALHLERDGDGYVVHYAIADVAAFVTPGDPVDLEANRRGETLYGADSKVPLHPTVISEDAGSLLPDQVRPGAAVDDQGRRDRRGHRRHGRARPGAVDGQARLRARAEGDRRRHRADESLALLAEVGELRLAREAAPRRGLAAAARAGDRRRRATAGSWSSAPCCPVEEWNAQISLLTGFGRRLADGLRPGRAAAHAAAAGPARRPAPAPHRARRWASTGRPSMLYPDFIRSLDPTQPAPRRDGRGLHPAAARQRVRRLRRRGARPAAARRAGLGVRPRHRAAAPARRPLRRRDLRRPVRRDRGAGLGAGAAATSCPTRCRSPAAAPTGTSARSSTSSRPACCRTGWGRPSTRVVVEVDEKDDRRGDITIQEPAVEARVTARRGPAARHRRRVRLTTADLATRKVEFTLVAAE